MSKNKALIFVIVTVLAALLLSACGGGGDSGSDAAADAGAALYGQDIIGAQPGCKTCHSLEAGQVIVGPSLAGAGSRAGTTVSGMSAEEYLQQSILEPDAHLVEGFPAGTMPKVWGTELSEEQIDQLVAFLMTLK
jgi:mono/diheme cytochrome c family protein